MAYSVQSDLAKLITPAQLAQLTDDDGDGYADTPVISEGIAEADAEIDSYLGSRYTVPVPAPVPALLRNFSVAIALWKLYSRRGLSNDARRQAYQDAIAHLKLLADGRAQLPAAAGGEVASDAADYPEASTIESDREYTRGKKSDDSIGSLDNF